ncbi:sugar transferase [Heyndrickxia faecalis]|uniref:Polysaccharide synthesis sugar transferase n=2 Tax=Heyndrickxia TaxID=2837504 RepID=A0AAN0T7U4_HEYCO|nr:MULTISPECIES: sugar transferase [Heyndrickxia]AJO24452.1 polysaccharide synthesis sugar transferase [Heyndrickxia coagulans]AKN54082.1 Undecaprenyl-phosphate galactosephosphotransferase [Heyndrickxia coagulans]ATW84275.1 sugar transferase [Heyndrickxia coagulans]KGB30368.1 multidrug MFS transporter [Heyndrickxia coagulans]KXT20288.1 multidrug MFS transporter [Heyndrickxia coagulans]
MSESSFLSKSVVRQNPQVLVLKEKKSYLLAKRTTDIIGSILGLVCFSWLFLIVAVLIKLEDPKGPVFFKQVRTGKNGKEFYMYKFRSMVMNAEEKLKDLLELNEVSGAMFKMKEDPRVTKIGRFIRKTSIDELPQLWNVLMGDMSLVGPRPPLPREVKEYTEYDLQRLLVTPGCTGLWQVSGRNSLNFSQMVELDLYYIRERSFLFDLIIIFKTFKIIISPNSAY